MLQLKHIALHTGVLTPPPKKKKRALHICRGMDQLGFCELGTRALTGKFALWLTHPHSKEIKDHFAIELIIHIKACF